MDRLRVALTLEQLWHRVPGGTATSVVRLARALSGRGDLELVGVAALHTGAPPRAFMSPIEVRHIPLPRPLLYDTWHRLRWPPIQRTTGAVDVVHATTSAVPPKTAPLVVTIHDLAFVDRPSDFTRRGMRLFLRGLDLARSDADIIIVPSEATRGVCVDNGIEDERLRVIPWGVDIRPAQDVDAVLAKHRILPPYVLWTGTLEPRKNLARLIEAFARVETGVQLVLAGPRGWGVDVLAGRDDGRVLALGFVETVELEALYAGAAAFCYPSITEGFGLPVLEAMAQGTPVVTSAGTSMAEVGGDAVLLVDPLDTAAIADALNRVLGDAALAQRLRTAGPARAAAYSWERTAELTAQVYRDAARIAG